jgi:hypothetical protein
MPPTPRDKRLRNAIGGVLIGVALGLTGLFVQSAVGIIYNTSTPIFLVQFVLSFWFLSVLTGEYVSRTVTQREASAYLIAGLLVTIFVFAALSGIVALTGFVVAGYNMTGLFPTIIGVCIVVGIVLAVTGGSLDLHGWKREIYRSYRAGTAGFLTGEAGLGYLLPSIGVKDAGSALVVSVVLGVFSVALYLISGPARSARIEARIAELEAEQDAHKEGIARVRKRWADDPIVANSAVERIQDAIGANEREIARLAARKKTGSWF